MPELAYVANVDKENKVVRIIYRDNLKWENLEVEEEDLDDLKPGTPITIEKKGLEIFYEIPEGVEALEPVRINVTRVEIRERGEIRDWGRHAYIEYFLDDEEKTAFLFEPFLVEVVEENGEGEYDAIILKSDAGERIIHLIPIETKGAETVSTSASAATTTERGQWRAPNRQQLYSTIVVYVPAPPNMKLNGKRVRRLRIEFELG